ncbi:MAG: T9SS type A sorting domain-containing protein, partial [Alphaproteobacteria bacterium]|nr:T9SS type A sorting domain-containing protein [Alphaproteobacteria bacterium]
VQNITWTDNISENVKIELLKGETYYETLVSSTPSTGSWSWTIPADQQVGIDYRIRITSVSDNAITDNSDASFKIMANVVSNLVVQNMEISNGSINCFDALNTITVAGNGSFFHVAGGSLVTFIAGMNILFLPGTYIHDNGMMHGYIAPTGPFCGTMAPSFIQVTTGEEEPVLPSNNPKILIYPNPTTGKITLEFVPENIRSGARIYIYSMNGAAILQKELPTMQKETFTLDFLPPGIYLCRILYDGKQELVKIVLQ